MDNKFEQWLLYVCEMHAACVQQENNTRDALLSNELCLAAENARLDTRSTFSEEARKVSETFVQHVQIAAEAYRTALDEFPPGYVHTNYFARPSLLLHFHLLTSRAIQMGFDGPAGGTRLDGRRCLCHGRSHSCSV